MKYGYIPLEPIISELQAQLKTMVKMGKFDDDDCYQYAVQCLRKIGVTQYDVNEEIIEIKRHKGIIPKHFYIFEEVRIARESVTSISPFHYNNKSYDIGKSLKPVDTITTTFCNENFYNIDCEDIGFTFKIPPGIISCDLKEALLYVKYHGLKRDDKGNYLIQDEENGIEAVKNFIKLQAMEEDYLMGKLPRYIYKDVEAKFDETLGCAQSALMEVGPAEIDAMINKDRRKFDKYKLK